MNNPAANNPAMRWNLLGPIIAVVVLAIPVAIYVMQPEPEPPAPAPTAVKEKKAPPRFGPGLFTESKFEAVAANTGAIDPEAPAGLAATPGQRLVVNKEMRDVLNYFLLAGGAADRATRVARLHAHLKAKLPATAYEEAVQIASTYLTYLIAFEKLMASEANRQKPETMTAPMSADEDARFSAKIAEISRLRQSMLGARIAQIWFAEEEEDMQQSLVEMRRLKAESQQRDNR